MKKVLRNSICLLLAICMLAGFIPVHAQAYEKKGHYRIYNLPQNKWTQEPWEGDDFTNIHRIRVPSDGYIAVSVNSDKCTGKHAHRVPAMLYTTYNVDTDYAIDKYHIANFIPGTHYVALRKGTYYFYAAAYRLRFKWVFHAVKRGNNNRMSRAETMTSGKNIRVCFNYGTGFTKWYKIKLSKKQKIQVFAKRMESKERYGRIYGPGIQATVVNSKGKKVSTTKLNTNMQLTGRLSKGTYYIKLIRLPSEGDREVYYGDRLISFTVSKK